jgi:uncharacterized protein YaiI (UPF0178 family)
VHIWIDADACPRDVKDVIYRASARKGVAVVVVANSPIGTPLSPLITSVIVKGGPDVADDHIAAHAAPGDVAVTQDIPLAARLVDKGVVAIDVRGTVFDADNIGERLSVRDFMADVRDAGVVTGGPKAWTPRDKQRFAAALDAALHKAR